jgi:uncharacterized protein YdaU (DUF1376 family)
VSDRPFVPFYTSDFLAGTSGMTASTKGVYITLLSLMYEAEAPLPQSWETLSRRCGCTKSSFKKAIEALEDDAKVSVTDAGIWSEKCDKHIAQRRERSDSAKAAAKKRWEKTQQNQPNTNATASSAQCKPEPEPYSKRDTKVSPKNPPLFSLFPSTVSEEVAKAYVEHRRAIKKPLTARAITLLSKTLAQCEANGIPADAALDTAIESGWHGLKLTWIQNALSQNNETNGAHNDRPRTTAYDRASEDQDNIASAWIAEGRRRDEEKGANGCAVDPFNASGFGVDSGPDGDPVVTRLPGRAERHG